MALLLFGQCHLHGQQAPFDFILALFSSIRNENPVSVLSVTAVSPAGKTGEIPFYFAFFACMVPPLYYMIMEVSGKDVIYVEKSKNTFCAEPDRLHAHR